MPRDSGQSEPDIDEEDERPARPPASATAGAAAPAPDPEPEAPSAATRIALQPVDRHTGQAVEREEVVKGYEFDRGQFVTFTPAELKALDVESSKTIDLATFVPRADVDPIYFNAPYYLYPDGAVATEAFRVIGAAMADAGMAGIGRVTMSRRERMVLVEPRGAGMVLITLRAAEEVRPADFGSLEGDIDPEMVAIAETIIKRRTGTFDPETFRDRYQEALRELVEAKLKGRTIAAKPIIEQAPVVDLMAALKRSLAQEKTGAGAKPKRKSAGDRRQTNLLLPVSNDPRNRSGEKAGQAAPARQRKKA